MVGFELKILLKIFILKYRCFDKEDFSPHILAKYLSDKIRVILLLLKTVEKLNKNYENNLSKISRT